jgi:hypothetical protein
MMLPLVISGVTIPNTYATNVTLATGNNNIQLNRVYNSQTYTDSVVWTYHGAALAGVALGRVDFTNSAGSLQSGYAADTGQAYGVQGANGTYGWVNSTTQIATANTAGTYNRTTPTTAPFDQIDGRTGIMLPTNRNWEFALPNGVYDVHVVAADSTNPAMVNNLTVEGFQLHDNDYSTDFTLKDNGFDEYYARVTVADGRLTLAAGPGSVSPRLAYIDVNSFTPPALAGDFNIDGIVDAADYTVWRDSLGANVATPYTGADGNGNGVVDQADYGIWSANFGMTTPPGAGAGAVALLETENSDSTIALAARMPVQVSERQDVGAVSIALRSASDTFFLRNAIARGRRSETSDLLLLQSVANHAPSLSDRVVAAGTAADSAFAAIEKDEIRYDGELCQSLAADILEWRQI